MAFISHQADQIDVSEHGSEEEDSTNDHSPDELLQCSVYNPPSILLHPNGPQQFLSLLKSREDFLRLQRK